MALAFTAVLGCYMVGRALDGLWNATGNGSPVAVLGGRIVSAPEMFAQGSRADYVAWRRAAIEERRRAVEAAARPGASDEQQQLAALTAPYGPFDALIRFSEACLSGAMRGAVSGRVGYTSIRADEPSLLGSVAVAGTGLLWIVTQHPAYTLIFGLLATWIFAFFGGAISRSAAMENARGQSPPLRDALAFAWTNKAGLLLPPLILLGVIAAFSVVMIIGGLVGAIPWFGEIVTGLLFFLALFGGGLIAFLLLAWLICGHLFVPAVAVEGAGAMDAVTRSGSYIGSAPWRFSVFALLLLGYGALAFSMLRLLALLTLKVTHALVDAGMSAFGSIGRRGAGDLTKLDAMWHMPGWGELSLLPGISAVPFYGTFGNAALNWSETVSMWLIALWVFIVVGVVAAALVSFYFVGCTRLLQMLRRDVDGEPIEQIYDDSVPLTESAIPANAIDAPAAE
jgi:hypothetical protein